MEQPAANEAFSPGKQDFSPGNIWEANRMLIKGMVIGFLILVLLIPSFIISNLVNERAGRREQVVQEVAQKWAAPQTISGPVLMVPYKANDAGGDRKMAYFLPERLDVTGKLYLEKRHRSIYEVTLYRSDIILSGNFGKLNCSALPLRPEQFLWEEARLVMGLNDARGLEEEVTLNWGDQTQVMEAGTPVNTVIGEGFSAPATVSPEATTPFTIRLKVKGSEYLHVTPAGKTTTVSLQSAWTDPKFEGRYLPQRSALGKEGFTARWKVPQASRAFPQQWLDKDQQLNASAFGVRLLQVADSYAKTDRSVKYALLFIGLTFTVFFFIELLLKKQVHPLQYFLVGVALVVFYSLLLSISEYWGFNKAYAVAACATIALIGLYVRSIFGQWKIAAGFTLALSALYAYIFFLIQLQDYALLFGSIGLFIIVAIVMYSSRKIDWYAGRKKPAAGS